MSPDLTKATASELISLWEKEKREKAMKDEKSAHTATPWRAREINIGGSERITIDAPGKWVELATVYTNPFTKPTEGTGKANAEFIIRAVNSHDALVIAAECARDQLLLTANVLREMDSDVWNDVAGGCVKQAQVLNAALSLVEEKQ